VTDTIIISPGLNANTAKREENAPGRWNSILAVTSGVDLDQGIRERVVGGYVQSWELSMKVKEIMSRHVSVVSPDDTIEKAASVMGDDDVGILPVLEGKRLVGIVTDRDIVVRGVSMGALARKWVVGDLMTENVSFCFEDDDIQSAITRMGEMRVRRMPVFDRRDVLTGIISLDDIAARGEWDPGVAHALRRIAGPASVPL